MKKGKPDREKLETKREKGERKRGGRLIWQRLAVA